MSSAQSNTFARRTCDGLAQIGPTRFDIVGARFIEGEGAAAPTPTPAPAPPAEPSAAATPPWGDDPSKFDPNKAWALIQNVKGDLAAEKQKRDDAIAAAVAKATADAQKNTLAEFAKLLTGETGPETDPEKLNQALTGLKGQLTEKDTALTQAQADAKAGQVALQVAILGGPLGANIPALLTNEAFKTSIASVEPTDGAAITAAITQALQANAALKQPPARSGAGEHTGPTLQSLESQLKAAQDKGDWKESIRLKRAIANARQQQA